MPEPIRHTNRRKDLYTLFEGKTKTGKPKYFFSCKPSQHGEPALAIPDGYEIYEGPNANVSLRRIPPRIIRDDERASVEGPVAQNPHIQFVRVEIERKRIVIYTAESSLRLSEHPLIAAMRTPKEIKGVESRTATFTAMLRFSLEDKKERLFLAERYCFRGSVDDWIYLDGPSPLKELADRFVPHLGQESFYDLPDF